MIHITSDTDPGLASPPSPYDDRTPCPECGIGDELYMLHNEGCPSGHPARDPELDGLQNAYWEYEEEAR
jgi:hypothetical protein